MQAMQVTSAADLNSEAKLVETFHEDAVVRSYSRYVATR